MSLAATIIAVVVYLAVPAGILALGLRIKMIRKINPVIICYVLGILAGNIGILPEGIAGVQDQMSSVVVALSIPLLLFSVNISRWSRTSLRAVGALGLAAIAVAIAVTVGHLIFGSSIPDSNKIAGMMVGLYTGGTPNLAAISRALGVASEPYLAVHASVKRWAHSGYRRCAQSGQMPCDTQQEPPSRYRSISCHRPPAS